MSLLQFIKYEVLAKIRLFETENLKNIIWPKFSLQKSFLQEIISQRNENFLDTINMWKGVGRSHTNLSGYVHHSGNEFTTSMSLLQ